MLSANGKTSFALKLCKELCRFGRVAYDSLEEGACLSMQEAIRRENMIEVNKRFLLIDNEDMKQLSLRLKRQKSPEFVVIDSFQYAQMKYDASLKIYVEGFRAFSKGRFKGPKEYYDIVPEKAIPYWGGRPKPF